MMEPARRRAIFDAALRLFRERVMREAQAYGAEGRAYQQAQSLAGIEPVTLPPATFHL
jgi:hypothetical protein